MPCVIAPAADETISRADKPLRGSATTSGFITKQDPPLAAYVQRGPLAGLRGSVLAATADKKLYLRPHGFPGITVVLPAHLLELQE